MTVASVASASAIVLSVEPSSTTTTSKLGSAPRMSRTTFATIPSSLYAGTIASLRS